MLGSLLCDAIAAKREDIFKAAIDGRSRAAWASLASPTCHRNGPGSAKCRALGNVFPPEEEAEEALRMARYDSFLYGPEVGAPTVEGPS